MSRVQKNFKNIKSLEKLQAELLKGPDFESVHAIASEGLKETFAALAFKTVGKGSYLPDVDFLGDEEGKSKSEQIALLRGEIEKSKNAITRLTDVYLYDPESMTKEEFASKKKELVKKVSELEKQLSDLLDDSGVDELADLSFIKKASAFLVAQRIASKNYVDYVQMALELDNDILKDFVDQIVDEIVVKDGRVESITFVNGLKHEFIYTRPAELRTCQLCGGRVGSTVGCRTRTFNFKNKAYRRIKVGDPGDDFAGKPGAVCPECYAQEGRWHHWKCGIERCPICGEQLIACEHGPNKS